MQKLLAWFSKHNFRLIHYLLWVYIFFMPLWPKIPFRTVNYTYIAVRYEDIFMGILFFVYIFDFFRHRKKHTVIGNPLLFTIPAFWLAVLVSALYGFYVLSTVITLELGVLHALRRVEYMMIFFIAYAVLENKEQFAFYVKNLFVALFLVCAYALGQKFLGLPAWLTMNPEYAKGHTLILTEDARITSLFGGHYDLAAYLVFMIPLVIGALFAARPSGKKWYFGLYVLSLLILSYTVSRTSFIAYIAATGMFIVFVRKWKFLVVFLIVSGLLLAVSDDLTTRFLKTIRVKQILVDSRTGAVYVPQKITPDELPAGSMYVPVGGGKPIKENKEVTDLRKKILKDKELKDKQNRLLTPTPYAGTPTPTIFQIKPEDLKVVSGMLYDISSSTRFQVEWPRAINAFLRSPWLGTGVSSLTEATDGDYFRWIGETGILGFALFMFVLGQVHVILLKAALAVKKNMKYLYAGLLFCGVGLFINALYIDVFEASKIAFYIWFVWGLFIKSTRLVHNKPVEEIEV